MGEPVKLTDSVLKKDDFNIVKIRGKVLRVHRYEGAVYTTVVCPARDEYSKPSVVQVKSENRFGDKDDQVTFKAVVGGYEGKTYQVTDKDTGEKRNVQPVNMFLDFVE
jgi:hypothetical protein